MSNKNSKDSTTSSMFNDTSIEPSAAVFCSSLESFAKYSVYPGKSPVKPGLTNVEKFKFSQDDQDPALFNWDRWQKVHKVQQDSLSTKLNRPPQCMLMNSNLNNLYVNQEKNVLGKALNWEFCDKFRGHRNFWLTGDNFKSDGKSLGIYQTVGDRYDRSHPKMISNSCPKLPMQEYVGVPDKIYEEKNLGREKCLPSSKSNWDRSEYVKKREEELREKLQMIRQHKPDVSDVIVVGKSVKSAVGTTPTKLEPESSDGSCATRTSTFCKPSAPPCSISVKIDEEIVPAESGSWVVFFGEQEVGKVLEKQITIKNNGISCVKYNWEIVFPSWACCELPLVHVRLKNRIFFFNKNDGSILPGQEKLVKLQFESDVAGVFCEKWEIHFSHSADTWISSIIDLQAVAINENDGNIKAIDSYIESCTKFSIARKSVEEILKRNSFEQPTDLPYNQKFFEEEIFLHNNPDLYYDNKLVHKLINIHRTIAKGPWDYSVAGLRNLLLERTLTGEKTTDLETLMSTVYELMKPNNFKCSLEKDKHQTVYDLLCCFANQMDVESAHLLITIGLPLQFLDLKNSEVELNSTSFISEKRSCRISQFSKKNSSKKSLRKPKSSLQNQIFTSTDSSDNSFYDSGRKSNENLYLKKQEYLEALFVKTYQHLSNTIDNMSAVLESYDAMRKKTILAQLKN